MRNATGVPGNKHVGGAGSDGVLVAETLGLEENRPMNLLVRSTGAVLILAAITALPSLADRVTEPETAYHLSLGSASEPGSLSAVRDPEKLHVANMLWPIAAHGVDAATTELALEQFGHAGMAVQASSLPPSYKAVWCPKSERWIIVCCNAVALEAGADVQVEVAAEILWSGPSLPSPAVRTVEVAHTDPGDPTVLQGPEVEALLELLANELSSSQAVDARALAQCVNELSTAELVGTEASVAYAWYWNPKTSEWELICVNAQQLNVDLASSGTLSVRVRTETLLTPAG